MAWLIPARVIHNEQTAAGNRFFERCACHQQETGRLVATLHR